MLTVLSCVCRVCPVCVVSCVLSTVPVPAAIAVYPKEILRPPRRWVEYFYTVKRWTEMPAGGHFPALEEPDSLVADIRAFFCDDLRLHDVFTAS